MSDMFNLWVCTYFFRGEKRSGVLKENCNTCVRGSSMHLPNAPSLIIYSFITAQAQTEGCVDGAAAAVVFVAVPHPTKYFCIKSTLHI